MPAWVNSPKLAPFPPAIPISFLLMSSNFLTYILIIFPKKIFVKKIILIFIKILL